MQTFTSSNDLSATKVETVSELVRRHMRDQYHNTTEEELRNALLETGVGVGVQNEKPVSLSEKNFFQIH